MTPEQERYLCKFADIGLADEIDIIARNIEINANARLKNIELGVVEADNLIPNEEIIP